MLSRFSPTAWVVYCLLGCSLPAFIPSIASAQLELSGPEQPVPPVPTAADPSSDLSLDTVDAPDLPEGAEVMVTGPLHEAFAEQFSGQPEPGIVISKKPPELINEIPPEYRPDGEDIVWIPGYWGWDPEREDFLWITGIWRQAPPDRNWVPGYWAEVPEGYQWIAGFWSLNTDAEIRYLPTPPEQLAADPSTPAPSEDHFWIPGQWSYVNNDYQWRAGYWTMGYPDWVWVPDRYVWTPLGCIYRAGYWDYVVAERGTVFCPVYWSQPAPNYQFRPTYVVGTGPTLLANLFVYPRYNHYFFGNYYSSRFLNSSIYPWVSYGQQSRRYDPLYGYYRTQYRDTDYMNRLQRLHNYYAANVNYQPPRTLTAQREHQHEHHDRQDLAFQAMQLSRMTGVQNNINHSMQLVKLAENERQQIQLGLDPARELRKQRAEIEAKNRPATPGNPAGKDRGDRNGDGKIDSQDRHWNLPTQQDGTRLGSIPIGQSTPRDRDVRDANKVDGRVRQDGERDGLKGDTNRDGIVNERDQRNSPDMRDRGARNENRDGQGRNPQNNDTTNKNPLSRDPQDKNPLNRDPVGRDSAGRDTPNRLPADGANRNPLNRNPLGRDTNPNDDKKAPNANDNRQPRDRQPDKTPGNLRQPGNTGIVPGVGAPGTQGAPGVPGTPINPRRVGDNPLGIPPGNPLGSGNERTKDRDDKPRPSGRNPNVPSNGASVPSANAPKALPGTPGLPNTGLNNPGRNNPGPAKPNDNDRNRAPRLNPSQLGIAPGEPNPGAARRGGNAATPPSANIQNDLQKMREASQKQIQRRTESPAPRRAPQPPSGGAKPEKPNGGGKPEKGKDK